MSDRVLGGGPLHAQPEGNPVAAVLLCSLILTALAGGIGWWLYGMLFARSVLVGSMLVNTSFFLLSTDIQRLTRRIGSAGDAQSAVIQAETVRFFINFLARLCVLGLLLFVLASKVQLHIIGLTVGLATVMCGVVILGLRRGFGPSNNV